VKLFLRYAHRVKPSKPEIENETLTHPANSEPARSLSAKLSDHSPVLFKTTLLIILFWGIAEGRAFLLPLFIAGLLAFLIKPFHGLLQKRLKFPDALAVAASVVIFFSPLVVFIIVLVNQVEGLVREFPRLMDIARGRLDMLAHDQTLMDLGIASSLDVDQIFQKISGSLGQGVGIVLGSLATIANLGSQVVLIFVFTILFLASRVHLRKSLDSILARTRMVNVSGLVTESTQMIQTFLAARMGIVVLCGVITTLELKFLGMNYPALFGTIFGLSTLVPAVGAIGAFIITFLGALILGHTVGAGLGMVAALLLVNLLENYVLTPKIVGNRLNLNALAVFVGLYAGGLMWGIWGMFLSIPVLGVLRILFSGVPDLHPWGELLSEKMDADPVAEK
jgi:putative permease